MIVTIWEGRHAIGLSHLSKDRVTQVGPFGHASGFVNLVRRSSTYSIRREILVRAWYESM
jgi:hypothetical protein